MSPAASQDDRPEPSQDMVWPRPTKEVPRHAGLGTPRRSKTGPRRSFLGDSRHIRCTQLDIAHNVRGISHWRFNMDPRTIAFLNAPMFLTCVGMTAKEPKP